MLCQHIDSRLPQALCPPFCPLHLVPHFALPSHFHFLSLWIVFTTLFSFILSALPLSSQHPSFPCFSVSLSHDFLLNTSSAESVLKPSALLLLYTSAVSAKSIKTSDPLLETQEHQTRSDGSHSLHHLQPKLQSPGPGRGCVQHTVNMAEGN